MRSDDLHAPLRFCYSEEQPCSYLQGKLSILEVAVPALSVTEAIYSRLAQTGFRRSGLLTYRPHCNGCQACIPVRLPVKEFSASRSQQRCLKKHRDLAVCERPLVFQKDHYALYRHYQAVRHAGFGTPPEGPEEYTRFLLHSHVDTRLIEFSEDGVVRMISIVDVLSDGLSSVYTFYDPDIRTGSLGTFSILWQIAQCLANDLPYLYLGYWIGECRKMSYKSRFRPVEGLIDGKWQMFDASPLKDARSLAL